MADQDPQSEYESIGAILTAGQGAKPGKMFGMPCLKINGKMFAGYWQDAMVFKLAAPRHAEALALDGARLFDPSGQNRPMKEWVVVPAAHSDRWHDLALASLAYVAAG